MRANLLFLCYAITACTAGCGSSPDSTATPTPSPSASGLPIPIQTPANNTVTLVVTTETFAFDATGATLATNLQQVGLSNPASVFAGRDAAPAQTTNVTATACQTTGGKVSCPNTRIEVDATAYTAGLLLLTSDNRLSSSPPRWQATYTYVPQAALTAALAGSHTLAVKAAALTSDGLTAIGTWSGHTSSDILNGGAALIAVLDHDGVTPVAGAKVVTGAQNYTVAYANAAGTAPNGTAVTATSGLALALSGTGNGAVASNWTITPPTGSNKTWTVPTLGSVPYALVVGYISAN